MKLFAGENAKLNDYIADCLTQFLIICNHRKFGVLYNVIFVACIFTHLHIVGLVHIPKCVLHFCILLFDYGRTVSSID